MRKINFLFGIHCHQPVGNFDHVFVQAYNDCYLPFLETMERHPKIKFSAHFSGILYDYFEKCRPEYLDLILTLVKRGQLELIAAGHYEPILPIIPDEDKLGQIEMQIRFIKKHFKTSPSGLWLTERIWEPNLPSVLRSSGIEYLTVDDYHFISAGIKKSELNGYYITEDQGQTLKVFPINKDLRYLIPFRLPQETIKYLSELSSEEGDRAAILADDGEKFGLWPGTNKWVFKDGYLENLLCELESNIEWIRPMTFSEYLDEFKPQGRAYLPTASYFEMMKWSLPCNSQKDFDRIEKEIELQGKSDEYNKFFKGGFFRNFFAKYPESNNMHKKMLQISQKLSTLKQTDAQMPQDREKLFLEAKKHLFMGQCNCAYWHGVFGGLYLSNLRDAIYENLIKAENIIQILQRGNKKYTELLIFDFDKDGKDELVLSNPYLNLYISPGLGGSIFELDYKPKEYNLLNVLTRREEAYHQRLLDSISRGADESRHESIHDIVAVKEQGIEKDIIYDKNRRMSLVDHFFPEGINFQQLKDSSYQEIADFAEKEYEYYPTKKKDEVSVKLSRISAKGQPGIKLSKSISLLSGQSIVEIEYEIMNLSETGLAADFGIEFNITLLASDTDDRYIKIPSSDEKYKMNSCGESIDISSFKLVDEWKDFIVSFEASSCFRLLYYPIETVSLSEGGFEKTYQGTSLMPVFKICLEPKETWKNKLVIRFES